MRFAAGWPYDPTQWPGGSGSALHYDGSAWSPMKSGTLYRLEGVWGTSGSDVYAAGWNNTILHYDGSAWSPMAGSAE